MIETTQVAAMQMQALLIFGDNYP